MPAMAGIAPRIVDRANGQMFSVERKYIQKRVWPFLIKIGALMVLLFPTGASGTYIAAIFSENVFVIGSDSRAVDVDGRTIKSSDACKILLLNDTTVFALVGTFEFTPDATKPLIKMYDLASAAGAAHGTNINAMASNFADSVADKLNLTTQDSQWRAPANDTFVAMGLFGGFNQNAAPQLTSVSIFYSSAAKVFVHSQIHVQTIKSAVIYPSYEEATRQILTSSDFKKFMKNNSGPEPQRLASLVDVLITKMIESNVSIMIGGTPTILIMERGKRPRWHRKAKDCPDLN